MMTKNQFLLILIQKNLDVYILKNNLLLSTKKFCDIDSKKITLPTLVSKISINVSKKSNFEQHCLNQCK